MLRTKALVTADLHYSSNHRDEYRHAFVDRLCKIIERREIGLVLVLGDLCEEKDNHPASLVNRVVGHFHRMSDMCPVIVLKGNHDYSGDPTNPFYAFLGRIPNIVWLNSPTGMKSLPGDVGETLGRVLFLPHTSNYEADWDGVNFKDYDLIFCHNSFAGASAEHGQKLTGIPTSVFPKNARIISGDVHTPQDVGPVRYVGAPYLVDFGDNYKPRLILLEGDKEISINLGGVQKRLVEVTDLADLPKLSGTYGDGDLLKVRVTVTPEQRAKWPEMQKAVRTWADRNGYVVNSVSPKAAPSKLVDRNKDKGRPKTDEQILEGYGALKELDERTLKTGMDFVESH